MLTQSPPQTPPASRVDLETAQSASALPAAEIDSAAAYAKAEKASATTIAYRADFDLFQSWCQARRIEALPALPQTLAAFLAFEADRGMSPSTIDRRVASIRYAHNFAGLPPPTDDARVRATCPCGRRWADAG
jgi:Phage integrase, N-terminal SAM-like domain